MVTQKLKNQMAVCELVVIEDLKDPKIPALKPYSGNLFLAPLKACSCCFFHISLWVRDDFWGLGRSFGSGPWLCFLAGILFWLYGNGVEFLSFGEEMLFP